MCWETELVHLSWFRWLTWSNFVKQVNYGWLTILDQQKKKKSWYDQVFQLSVYYIF